MRQPPVPALGHPGRVVHGLGFSGVVINVEMLRGQDLEFELVVLDFVPAELRVGVSGSQSDHDAGGEDEANKFLNGDGTAFHRPSAMLGCNGSAKKQTND